MDKVRIGEMLKRLVAVDGPSGAEERVGAVVRELARPHADEVSVNTPGSVIARRRGAGSRPPSVMMAAHMDEIGMIVTRVDHGFLHIGRIGGVDPRSLVGQEVTVYPTGPGAADHPDGLLGFIGSRPPHVLTTEDRARVIPLHDLRIDLGATTGERGQGAKGIASVRVGDRVVVRGPYLELAHGRVAAKALDNRASLAAMLGAMGYLAEMRHAWDVAAVATVQEETGSLGAATSAFGVAPDLAIAIDVTFGQTPGLSDAETVDMDKGPAVGLGPNLHPAIVKALRSTAEAFEIPHVVEPIPGDSSTDAWVIQITGAGIPTGLLSIPVRYMHSATEMVVLADVDRTARLLAAFISRLDDTFLAGMAEEV